MTREDAIICKAYLKDLDKYHTCNEYKLLMQLLEQEPCEDCCNGNQIEKAKLCQKSYLAGMKHKQEPILDKIRIEIKKEIDRDDHADEYCDGYYDGMRNALAIIDKYKAESEGD